MKAFEGDWLKYRSLVLQPDTPRVQVDETRRAFYAGAYSLYVLVMATLGPGTESTDADVQFMADLHSELCEFFRTEIAEGFGKVPNGKPPQ